MMIELYNFLYVDHTMEIFGHSPSTEMNTFVEFNEFYLDNRDNHDILLVSDEIGKSKPATLFLHLQVWMSGRKNQIL